MLYTEYGSEMDDVFDKFGEDSELHHHVKDKIGEDEEVDDVIDNTI